MSDCKYSTYDLLRADASPTRRWVVSYQDIDHLLGLKDDALTPIFRKMGNGGYLLAGRPVDVRDTYIGPPKMEWTFPDGRVIEVGVDE